MTDVPLVREGRRDVSQFANSPAIRKILRALGTGETLSGKEIQSRTSSAVNKDQREKLVDAGLMLVDSVGRTYHYRLTADGMSFVESELGGAAEAPRRDPGRLPANERVALFALLSPSLQLATAEIKRTLGVTVSPATRSGLRDRGLVVVFERPIRLELTEKGWQVAEEELSRPAEAGDPPLLRLLHHQGAQLLGGLRAHGLGLVDMYTQDHTVAEATTEPSAPAEPKSVGARVIDAYPDLVGEPGGWVGLARLRQHLADVDRTELDTVLTSLFRDDRIKLLTEVNQRSLTEADRVASLTIGGDEKHLYAVG